MKLRDYQQHGVDAIRAAFRAALKSVLYFAPTGSGKTVLFTYVAQGSTAKGRSVAILVHRQELVTQTSRALDQWGVPHGIIAPGFTPSGELVQVCSKDALIARIRRGKAPRRFDLIVTDEAHHAVAGTWLGILEHYPDALHLGVTATPCRADGKGLGRAAGGVFDSLVEGPAIGDLIRDGYLCAPAVYAPPSLVDMSGARTQGGDWARGESAKRVDRPTITGDAVAHYKRICPGAPAIVFCVSIEHAKHVAAEFRAAGFRFVCVDGKMADHERRAAIEGLAAGKLHGITSCEIVSEGTDIPVVAAAILLRPTKSLALFLQQVGRALRPVYLPGADLSTRAGRLAAIAGSMKPRAIILDHVGNVGVHGLPDDDREWTLDGVTKRSRAANDNEPAVHLTRCPQCFAAFKPAPICPQCGFEIAPQLGAPKQVDGELQEITPEQAEAMRRQKRRKVARAQTLEELQQVAKDLGYRPGWAKYVWDSRQRKRA